MFVIENACIPFIQFSYNVNKRITDNGYFTIVKIIKDQPVFISIFAGLSVNNGEIPTEERKAAICVFDPATRDADGQFNISLRVNSPVDGAILYMNLGLGDTTTRLNAGENDVRVTLAAGERFPQYISVHADAQDVCINEYEVLYE